MDPSEVNVPQLKDLTIDNITDNVKRTNGQCPDPRLKYILERLVQHVHDFARETRLSHNEWSKSQLMLNLLFHYAARLDAPLEGAFCDVS